MNPTHLTRTELYHEIKKLKSERDHWKLKAEQAQTTLIEVKTEIHKLLCEMRQQ